MKAFVDRLKALQMLIVKPKWLGVDKQQRDHHVQVDFVDASRSEHDAQHVWQLAKVLQTLLHRTVHFDAPLLQLEVDLVPSKDVHALDHEQILTQKDAILLVDNDMVLLTLMREARVKAFNYTSYYCSRGS